MNHVDNPFQSPVVLSFCPGILGIERGLARTGIHCRVAAYVEIEAFIIANLVAGMEAGVLDPAPIWTDIKTFDASPFRGKVHGIIGGYPCQPFSQNGKRGGQNDPRHLWPFIRKHIEAVNPIWCLFENVPGHLTCGYKEVRQHLKAMDFTVKEGIYSAAEVGATIKRERLFILAIAGGIGGRIPESKERLHKDEAAVGGSILAIANGCRGRENWQPGKQWAGGTQQSSFNQGNGGKAGIKEKQDTRWPASPYTEQFEWEEKRTVESCMGSTINGYNFRNDLLRALGNSVVEQTAELAFIDLLNKHRANLS